MNRWTILAATTAAVALLAFPLLRPWPDETTATTELAEAFASGPWVAAHLLGILGLVLLAPVFAGLRSPAGPRGQAAATWAAVTAWAGASLSALYYGAETFGVETIARSAAERGDLTLLAGVDELRLGPLAVALFALGLLLIAAAGVLAAVAVWRSGAGPRWAGVPLAAALVLYLPQFFGGPGLRIAHGALAAAGLVLVALWVHRTRQRHP